MAEEYKFCFLDLETTGHEPLRRVGDSLVIWHEIIDIGAVFCGEDLKVITEFETKVKPKHPERCIPNIVNNFPERAGSGEWEDAPILTEALVDLLNYCRKLGSKIVLIGQNFSFDWLFLSAGFAWSEISEQRLSQIFDYARLDTRSMAVQELGCSKRYNPSDYSLRGDILSNRLGISRESYPRKAINGARQSHLVFKKLREIHTIL